MSVKLIVRNSLPQDIEPISKNIIPDDLEKLNLYGYSKGAPRDRIASLMSGGRASYTVSSESGVIGFAYGLLNTLEICKLSEGRNIVYVPLWILGTTTLAEHEKEFFEGLGSALYGLYQKTLGLSIAFFVDLKRTNRVRHLKKLDFISSEKINQGGRDFALYVRKP